MTTQSLITLLTDQAIQHLAVNFEIVTFLSKTMRTHFYVLVEEFFQTFTKKELAL
ncbi:hypothetical protein [Virgibacillus necropolis]|uniref:hypothetical protein n=1 Tax=Virgibacillus necropolis TaxID=163877 RepID=UPI00137476F4|nr:hypothetical protein [Virgibacillus necropolis]